MGERKGPSRSLRTRFSLLGSLLLLAVLGAFSVAAYGEVKNALTRVTEVRLLTAADQLTSLLDQSVSERVSTLRSLQERSEVRSFLERPGPGTETAVRSLLDSMVTAAPARLGMTLRTSDRAALTAGDASASDTGAVEPGVSPFREDGERVVYSVAAAVEVDGEPRGTVVERRTVTTDPQTGQLLRDLIGEDAVFLVGHRDGELWTDLSGPVNDFAPPETRPGSMVSHTISGAEMFGLLGTAGDTPWITWVGLPTSVVMQPLTSFMRRIGGTALVLAVLGGVGAWTMGRRITRPLEDLTDAAEAIEAGDYSRRITTGGHDEIGRLGKSFNEMAAKVQEGRDRLEQRVADRTAELEEALADLTAAQEELVRKERLALLGELAGGVGHELRNPLGVMTNAVFYLDAVLKDRTEQIDEYLGILRDQIHVSEKIVGDLLDFARVKPPQLREVELPELVEAQLTRGGGATEGIEVRRDFPDDLPPAHVDPDQVSQVILNLVTNAFQALEETGGTLTLRGTAGDALVRLEVSDDGPGIPPDEREKIFEPLFTTKPKGIGLGLSVSRSLAESNGGDLSVESAPGRGATFILELPTRARADGLG